MKTTDTRAFANQLLVCLLVTFGFGGSIGLGTVWMRHQNALLAKSNRALEANVAELKRRIDETTTQVEGEQASDVLRRRNAEWRLGFAPAAEQQVRHMPEDPIMRLARLHRAELFADGVVPVTVRFAMKN
jgi:hypothetical protein